MFCNEIRSIMPTSPTVEWLRCRIRIYDVQLVFKYYGSDYNVTPKMYRGGCSPSSSSRSARSTMLIASHT